MMDSFQNLLDDDLPFPAQYAFPSLSIAIFFILQSNLRTIICPLLRGVRCIEGSLIEVRLYIYIYIYIYIYSECHFNTSYIKKLQNTIPSIMVYRNAQHTYNIHTYKYKYKYKYKRTNKTTYMQTANQKPIKKLSIKISSA